MCPILPTALSCIDTGIDAHWMSMVQMTILGDCQTRRSAFQDQAATRKAPRLEILYQNGTRIIPAMNGRERISLEAPGSLHHLSVVERQRSGPYVSVDCIRRTRDKVPGTIVTPIEEASGAGV